MFKQTTKLELIIVVAALVVLLLCRQPPKSGNAGVRMDAGPAAMQNTPQVRDAQMPSGAQRSMGDAGLKMAQGDLSAPQLSGTRSAVVNPSLDGTTSDNYTGGPAVPPEPKPRRIGMVDARRCNGLNYKDVMYGEITIQWVWNGQRVVPRKVILVREQSGATSIWAFDERDDVILSEIEQ
jgi:hypothetical protein